MMIGWRNAWSMKLRVQDQGEDQRGPGKRLFERTVKHVSWIKRMPWTVAKWRKVIKKVCWPGWVWAGECFFWYRPTRVVPDKRPLNGCCCCYFPGLPGWASTRKVIPIWILMKQREWQWHQLGYMQVCTSLQTDNHASTPPLSFFTGWMPFLPPNQQRQSTEGNISALIITNKW